MGFRNNSFAKVWEVKPARQNFTEVRLSISKKNKNTGEYDTEFSGYVRFIGKAHEKIRELVDGDRIRLDSVDVTCRYDKDKKVTYTNFICYDWTPADEAKQTDKSMDFVNVPDGIDDENPFA